MMKKINLKYLLIAICAIQLIAILFLLDYSLEKEIVYPPILNFMSYSPSKCRSEFTPMQFSLMKKFGLTYRKKLIIK